MFFKFIIMQVDTIKNILRKKDEGAFDLFHWNKLFIERIKKYDHLIKAWAYFDEQLWLSMLAKKMEDGRSSFGSLFGIPIGVKDIFNTVDMPTCMGSSQWIGFTPGNDARVVHNLKFHDAIIAGKTVTAEFAVHAPNETRNPWNIELSPGTSSSGSAAAVACGMIPASIGTQTAGSIIRPASYCGVYGFKPTFGTLPRTGMLKTTDSLDSIGLFATNIDDCRLLFDAMRVKGPDYPLVNRLLENSDNQKPINQGKWKIAVLFDQVNVCKKYEQYALETFEVFVRDISKLSCISIEYPAFDSSINEVHSKQEILYHKSLAYYFKNEFKKKDLISQVMFDIISEGNKISLEEFRSAQDFQKNLTNELQILLSNYDFIITLSTAGIAPQFGTAIDKADTCLIWTMAGLPVVNVPAFFKNGIPFGFQIISRKYTDYKILHFLEELINNGILNKFSNQPPGFNN
jgi:Asp-tRNA(Asn)/Glu-tRNA(Gln) amidotransferase A subunit family amidase